MRRYFEKILFCFLKFLRFSKNLIPFLLLNQFKPVFMLDKGPRTIKRRLQELVCKPAPIAAQPASKSIPPQIKISRTKNIFALERQKPLAAHLYL